MTKKKIIYIHKARFHERPPVISAVMILHSLGYDVTIITAGLSVEWKDQLSKMGIRFNVIEGNCKSRFLKAVDYYRFRHSTFSFLNNNKYLPEDTLLWVESAYTIVALGKKLKKYHFVLQIQELYEKVKYQLKAIANVINNAEAVFMPEYNRCSIYQVWYKLNKRPYLLPNKPYFVPDDDNLKELQEKYKTKINELEGKKNIIYQGLLHKERDLSCFVKAVKELHDYRLVLLGKDLGMLKHYKEIDSEILHIDFLPAPDYLAITSKAYIGIVTYDPMELNTSYCAPNKIYEYGYFGLPMVGNEVPGLKYTIEMKKAGVLVDEHNEEDIKNAILRIDANYDEYRQNARSLYDSVDNENTIRIALQKIMK